jgi:hypothetical protein
MCYLDIPAVKKNPSTLKFFTSKAEFDSHFKDNSRKADLYFPDIPIVGI